MIEIILSWIWVKIKEERWILLFLAILGVIRAYWHISTFKPDSTWLPIWDYPFGIESPPFDTLHVMGGLFILMIIIGLRMKLRIDNIIVNRKSSDGDYIGLTRVGVNNWWQTYLIVIVEFCFLFFVFDLFYHVLFMLPEHQEWGKAIFFLKWFGL
jgi:hypothetical protein